MKTFLLKLKLLFCLWSVSFLVNAQIDNPKLTPSDGAQGVQKFSETSVNNSTGVPQLSFPIGTLQGEHGIIPFSLVYDASGRRVDELASSYGWGWSLIGGGQINRVIKGEQDEYESCIDHMYQNHGELGIWELISWSWRSTVEPNTGGPYVRDFVSPISDITVDPGEDGYHEERESFQPDEYHF
jgi:hypothetical protein